jgi:predicted nucleic acid-binding protein
MNGNKALLDTNVLILASKNQIDVEKLLNSYDEFYVSVITLMEVYGFEFTNTSEKDLVDEMFANLDVQEVSIEIATQVIVYKKNKNKKIKLPDAIILATAKHIGADLISDDWDDFINIDNKVVIEKLDKFKY